MAKKVIRLNEQDIENLVKKIIKEDVTKEDLIQSIKIGYDECLEDLENEDNDDYEPTHPDEDCSTFRYLPTKSVETQYAWEFGFMMAREGMTIEMYDMDEYLVDILHDSGSNLTINDI